MQYLSGPLYGDVRGYSAAYLEQHAAQEPAFARWRAGYGPIQHHSDTQALVVAMAADLVQRGIHPNVAAVYDKLSDLDRLTAAAMWVVVHMTYAQRVRLDGQPLHAEDFKEKPEGHTGGALNMAPAYAAYLMWNALTGETRSWLMGQGHSVAAIEALNVLVGNVHPEQAQVYGLHEAGLSQLVADFYCYALAADGTTGVPLGSHANPHTAGAVLEGGYLGFAELQYAHMPLRGEKLIAFLSDGAAEEQRGSDWIPRWWRAQDSGYALPIMIANGRRIEQRTALGTASGLEGFKAHLRGCGFDPIHFDGRDPAAFVTTLWQMEGRLALWEQRYAQGLERYPAPIPYGIAESEKGYGFYGADQNAAHNLPLPANPRYDEQARDLFNRYAQPLWVSAQELQAIVTRLNNHKQQGRVQERDHALAIRHPSAAQLPPLQFTDQACTPMQAMDEYFVALVEHNPHLRPRVGNPDELASNRLLRVLERLKHRVTDPEGAAEDIHGDIITALNEEAVVSACLGNQGGLNLVASYEAFCVKMLGALRQRIIFARMQKEVGRPAGWISWPVVATSHTWENGKNQQSHQDTTFCEALLGEMNDVSRVLFPADYNSVMAVLPSIYGSRGQIVCMVVPKQVRPMLFTEAQALQLAQEGALIDDEYTAPRALSEDPILLVANGSYQLEQMRAAARRLQQLEQSYRLVYIQEPGRFRQARDRWEAEQLVSADVREYLFRGPWRAMVGLTHMRPEILSGHLSCLWSDIPLVRMLGYINRGGTLNDFGMQFANRATWAHVIDALAPVLGTAGGLQPDEQQAVAGVGNPWVLQEHLHGS